MIKIEDEKINITYVDKCSLIRKPKFDESIHSNTTIALFKEYKCLIIENITKLISEEDYLKFKSVRIFY